MLVCERTTHLSAGVDPNQGNRTTLFYLRGSWVVQLLTVFLGGLIVLLVLFYDLSGCYALDTATPAHIAHAAASDNCDAQTHTLACSLFECSGCGVIASDVSLPLFKMFVSVDVLGFSSTLLVPLTFSSFWHPPA